MGLFGRLLDHREASADGVDARTLELEVDATGDGRIPSYGMFRECYERGLMTNRKLEGRVTVRFVIQQDGSVDQIANGGSDLPSEDVINCVLHGFRALNFPAPRGGIVTVQYPILLVTR